MRVLLFSQFALPDSCAAATRVMNIAKILINLGNEVDLLGVAYKQENSLIGEYDGIPFTMIQANAYSGVQAWRRERDLDQQIQRYLEAQKSAYQVVVLSNVYFDHAQSFMRYAKKHHARLVVNAVEWYALNDERFHGIRGAVNLMKNRVALCWTHVRMKNILAISSLLDSYYEKRGCNTITVPTIVDMKEYGGLEHSEHEKIHIAYAGSPAKKDYILNAIRALTLLTVEERAKIELHLYGPEVKQLQSLGLSDELLRICGDSLVCHGRIPYNEVKRRIADADFTVLLRPNARYANAGFPTKVGESMACGTPVIANHTSDLHKYIRDGETGIVVHNESAEACAIAFRKAIHLSHSERAMMRKMALKEANSSFNYLSYVEPLRRFIEECHQYD